MDAASCHVGDFVRLTKQGLKKIEDRAKDVFSGLPTGRIIEVGYGSPPIGVEWDVMPTPPLHNCNAQCIQGTGWYVYPDMIEKVIFEDKDFDAPPPMDVADFLRLAYDCAADRSAT